LCERPKARMHACHCHLSSLVRTLALVPSTNHSDGFACSYPTIKTSTTPVVVYTSSTVPWHASSSLSPGPYYYTYYVCLVGPCCFACLDVYIHINDQCNACLILSPTKSKHGLV
jgi:hypothetical protein